MNQTIVTDEDLNLLESTYGPLVRNLELPCASGHARRIFGPTTLGHVLIVDTVNLGKGLLVFWC